MQLTYDRTQNPFYFPDIKIPEHLLSFKNRKEVRAIDDYWFLEVLKRVDEHCICEDDMEYDIEHFLSLYQFYEERSKFFYCVKLINEFETLSTDDERYQILKKGLLQIRRRKHSTIFRLLKQKLIFKFSKDGFDIDGNYRKLSYYGLSSGVNAPVVTEGNNEDEESW